MKTSYDRHEYMTIFRKSLAISNIGVSLLARREYSQALRTFEDALRVVRLTLNECLGEALEQELNCRSPMQSSRTPVLCDLGKANKHMALQSQKYSDERLKAAQKRLCSTVSSSDNHRPFPSFIAHNTQSDVDSDLLIRNKKQKFQVEEVSYSRGGHQQDTLKRDMDVRPCRTKSCGYVATCKGSTQIVPALKESADISLDCRFYYIEGHGIFQDVSSGGSYVRSSGCGKQGPIPSRCGPQSPCSRPTTSSGMPDRREEVATACGTLWFYPIWFETSSQLDFRAPSHRSSRLNKVGEQVEQEDQSSEIENEVNIAVAIITINMSIACHCLAQQWKVAESKVDGKNGKMTIKPREQLAKAGFRTLNLVLDVLSKVREGSLTGSATVFHTIAMLHFFVYQSKQLAYRLAGLQAEAECCRNSASYYSEILERINAFYGAATPGKLTAAAA